MIKECSNCKYEYLLKAEEPCCDCYSDEGWKPKEKPCVGCRYASVLCGCTNEDCDETYSRYEEESQESSDTQIKIEQVCRNLERLLKEKNKRYGDSALDPKNIFSKLKSDEQIKVRLDDKLSRINNSGELRKNDLVDITGYLVLLMISKDWIEFEELLD